MSLAQRQHQEHGRRVTRAVEAIANADAGTIRRGTLSELASLLAARGRCAVDQLVDAQRLGKVRTIIAQLKEADDA